MKLSSDLITKCKTLNTPAIIAISGFGGSGKSTFANFLGKEISVPVIGLDSFSKNRLLESSLWNSMDFARLEKEILIPFSSGKNKIIYGHYDWGKNKVIKKIEVKHNGFLILEGVGLFRPNLDIYFNYKIWVDCLMEEAIRRGKKRDREVYKNPQDEKWDGVWKKNDLEYFEKFKPKEMADTVINNCDQS